MSTKSNLRTIGCPFCRGPMPVASTRAVEQAEQQKVAILRSKVEKFLALHRIPPDQEQLLADLVRANPDIAKVIMEELEKL